MQLILQNISSRLKKLSTKAKAILLLFIGLLMWFYFSLPKKLFNSPASYVIEDADGNLLNASIAADGQWRFPYNNHVPQKFIDCITTFEDKRFFDHPGVDPIAMSRAMIKNIRNRSVVQGGSTLAMQLIR